MGPLGGFSGAVRGERARREWGGGGTEVGWAGAGADTAGRGVEGKEKGRWFMVGTFFLGKKLRRLRRVREGMIALIMGECGQEKQDE